MQGRKTFKYRVEANQQTIKIAEGWLSLCCDLYNTCLKQRNIIYQSNNSYISSYAQMRELPALKKEFPEYKNIDSQVLVEVIQRLDRTYSAFAGRLKNGKKAGLPRFKSKLRYDSFTLKGHAGWAMDGKYLHIKKVGTFKIKLSRPIEGDIKTVTIRRTSTNKWYVCFSCKNVSCKILPHSDKITGIDVGCESFLTTSEGLKVDNPRFFNKSEAALARRKKISDHRVKGSKRKEKSRILVAKAYEKIYYQRRDFNFKLVNQLLKYYGTIYIEKMDSWNSCKALNKSMRDVAWFGFFQILKGKAEEAGRSIIEVPAKGTSQLCSQCGVEVPKDLSIRIHSCPHCHLKIDRDINAAINILRAGQALQKKPLHKTENLSSENVNGIQIATVKQPIDRD